MEKIKELFKKNREIIMYIIFGVLTTIVSLISYYAILFGGMAIFSIEGELAAGYVAVYTVAKVVSWILAVTFAFFTNKWFVFEDKAGGVAKITKQYVLFAASRLATFGLDFLINLGLVWLLTWANLTFLDGFMGFSLEKINNITATLVAQVVVLIGNYIISKLLVFRKKKN